jgi:hypothetical protein
MMNRPLAVILGGLIAATAGGCTVVNVVPPFYNTEQYKSAAEAARTDTSFIPPTDPRYSESGAPRAGEPTGATLAGDPRMVGESRSYGPIGSGRQR